MALNSAAKVSRHRRVKLIRIGKVEIVHDLNKLLSRAREARVESALLAHAAPSETVVVVSRIDCASIGECQQLRVNVIIQMLCRSSLEILFFFKNQKNM